MNDKVDGSTPTCVACLELIKAGASRCPHCSSYQKIWRNWLPLVAGGILTAVASLLALIQATATDVWKGWTWHDQVTVVAFQSDAGVTVSNLGSGALFLESVTAKLTESDYTETKALAAVVPQGLFFDRRFEESPRQVDRSVLTSPAQLQLVDQGTHRLGHIFFSIDHIGLETLQRSTPNLPTATAECTVHYRSERTPAIRSSTQFPCKSVGTLEPFSVSP